MIFSVRVVVTISNEISEVALVHNPMTIDTNPLHSCISPLQKNYNTLKNRINGEEVDYERLTARIKTQRGTSFNLEPLMYSMFVVPVHFNKEHKSMLAHCKQMMGYNNGNVAIHPRFNKLITALRTAVEDGNGSLDKAATSYDNVFDAFRLSLQFWH